MKLQKKFQTCLLCLRTQIIIILSTSSMRQFGYMLNSVMLAVHQVNSSVVWRRCVNLNIHKHICPCTHFCAGTLEATVHYCLREQAVSLIIIKGLQFTPNSLSCISSSSIKLLNRNTNYIIRIRSHEKYCFIRNIQDAISVGLDNGVSRNFITY